MLRLIILFLIGFIIGMTIIALITIYKIYKIESEVSKNER